MAARPVSRNCTGGKMWFCKHRTGSFILACVTLGLIGCFNTIWIGESARWSFVATLALNCTLFGIIGSAVNGCAYGVLVDSRNKVSLSKFQAALWTILVLSSAVTAAAVNLKLKQSDVLNFAIPTELLLAMGLSAASLLATPALLSLKADQNPSAMDLSQTAKKLDMAPADMKIVGKIFGRADVAGAAMADMFRGDEVGNAASADLSKVQQFIVTLLLVSVYGAGVWYMFGEIKQPILTLPPLSQNFVWLLGISHASYLLYKVAPHSTSEPASPGSTS